MAAVKTEQVEKNDENAELKDDDDRPVEGGQGEITKAKKKKKKKNKAGIILLFLTCFFKN